MANDDAVKLVIRVLSQVIADKGQEVPPMTEGTVVLGGDLPVDSLDLAVSIVQLQNQTGRDPFREGFINFRTVGELAALYDAA